MRCPKCGYYSFDYLDTCPRCGTQWEDYKAKLNVKGVKPQRLNFLKDLLAAEESTTSQEALTSSEEIKETSEPAPELEGASSGEIPFPSEGLEKGVEPALNVEDRMGEEEFLPSSERLGTEEFPEEQEVFSSLEGIEDTLELAPELEGKEELSEEDALPSLEEIEKLAELIPEEGLVEEKVAPPQEDTSFYPETKSVLEELEETLPEIEEMNGIFEKPEEFTTPQPIELLEEIEDKPLHPDVSKSEIEVLEDIEPPEK